ncbi:MAG: hypothetical protein FWC03_01360 [Treponema sp.]|nr:hypothetical protein [Treponema sp.]
MDQHYLNNLYSEYTEKLINRCEFEGLVYQYLLNNQEKTSLSNWETDDYKDYLSWIYTRLHNTIDSYQDTGSSFDAYIGSVIHHTAREYRVKLITNSVIEYAAWSVQVPDMYVYDDTPSYSCEKQENTLPRIFEYRGRKNPKQLLALILKCYYYVSDDFINRAAGCTGIDGEKLKEMINKLRVIRRKKDDAIYYMKERIHCQYYRCIVYEKRLSYVPENTSTYIRLKYRLEKARKRLESMRKRITGVRTDATNREVADIIGISKGAVDASLHRLKNKWREN